MWYTNHIYMDHVPLHLWWIARKSVVEHRTHTLVRICWAEHVPNSCYNLIYSHLELRSLRYFCSIFFWQFQVIVRNIPRVSSHSTSETVDEFFRRNHPDHYLGQQVHGPLLCLRLLHLAFGQAWLSYILLSFQPIANFGCCELWWLLRQPCFLWLACLQCKSVR